MPKRVSSSDKAPMIKIKRESWKIKKTGKNSLHSVARSNGKFIATRPWHTKKDTEKVKDFVVLRVSFPKEYEAGVRRKEPSYSGFHKTGIRPDKYVYLMKAKFDKEYRTFSMTNPVLFTMDKDMKTSLFSATRHAYGDSPIKLKLIRIYNSRTMESVKNYTGQRFET